MCTSADCMITKNNYVYFSTTSVECFQFFFFFHEMLEIYICFSKESKPDLFILRTKRLHFTHLSGKDDRLWSQATWVHSQVLYLLTVWPWISLSFLICKMGVDNTIELYEDEMSDVCKIHSGVPGIQ